MLAADTAANTGDGSGNAGGGDESGSGSGSDESQREAESQRLNSFFSTLQFAGRLVALCLGAVPLERRRALPRLVQREAGRVRL